MSKDPPNYKSAYSAATRLVGNGATSDADLYNAGGLLLGNRFGGVYASDTMPSLRPGQPIAFIVNTDSHDKPGTHWLGVHYDGNPNHPTVNVYDSFGRSLNSFTPDVVANLRARPFKVQRAPLLTRKQFVAEDDCGARVLAWLQTQVR